MDDYPYQEMSLYVFDKAYVKTASLYKINKLGAFFIVRRKQKMEYEVFSEQESPNPNVYGDRVIRFVNRWAREGYPDRLRQYYSREQNKLMEFLTNNLALDAALVAEVYRNRCAIELFFRWIKQHLHLKSFYERSANAVLIQIYVAITAYCWVTIAAETYRFKGGLYDFLRILSVSLFEKRLLREIIEVYQGMSSREENDTAWPYLFDSNF